MPLEIIPLEMKVVVEKKKNWIRALDRFLQEEFDRSHLVNALLFQGEIFPQQKEWPEVDPSKRFALAHFQGERFKSFMEVDVRLVQEGIDADRRTLPFHLLIAVAPLYDALWRYFGNKRQWIWTSSAQAFLSLSHGDELRMMSIFLTSPAFRRGGITRLRDPEHGFNYEDSFLVMA